MIIRLNTTFPNYIGTLTTWGISWKGDGYTYDGELPRSVKKNEAFNITVKVASGYTYDSVPITIKMGGTDIPESAISRNSAGTITINIASVTGKLVITIGEVASGGGSEETTLIWYVNPRSEYSVFEGVSNHTSGPFGYASSWALEQLTGKTINRIGLEIVELGSAGISYGLFDTTTNTLTKIGTFADDATATGYQVFSIPDLVIPENNFFCIDWKGETGHTWSFNKSPVDDKYKFKSGFKTGSAPMAGLSTTALAIELGYEG